PDYVPLLKSTYELWDDLEKSTGQSLFQRTGLLQVGEPQSSIIQGVKTSAGEHALTVREFDNATLRETFPLFHFRDNDVGVLEENAGFLRVEKCVNAFARAALEMDAELVEGVTIEGWDKAAAGYEVTTSQGRFFGRRLIIAAGAWAHQLMPELGRELRVIAKHQHWFRIPD
ncbi:MAG: FAD-dependent oxidoreductase, partial [Planctomycetaceae bacterium]|nr:FAD-dependent oxidoreductase [Planctomycetaceae bacterium]